MRSFEIWILVLLVALITPFISASNPSTDEFTVLKVLNISVAAASNQIAIVSAGNGKICFAYRANDTSLVFGHGTLDSINLQYSTIDKYSFFDVAVMPLDSTCILFYTKWQPNSMDIYHKLEGNSDFGPDNSQLSWNEASTMSVIVYPGNNTFLFGFSFINNAGDVKYGLISYDPSALSNRVRQIETSLAMNTDLNNTPVQAELIGHGTGSISIVAALKDGQLWTGGLVIKATPNFSVQTLTTNAVSVTTQSISSGDNGVICYTSNGQVFCQQWTPNSFEFNSTSLLSMSVRAGYPSLALLNNDKTASVLFGQANTGSFFAYQIQNGRQVSQNPFDLKLEGTFSLFAANADSNNNIAVLARDTSSGQVYIVQIQHDYCGNGIVNTYESCDLPDCSFDCTGANPSTSGPFGMSSPIGGSVGPDGKPDNSVNNGPKGDSAEIPPSTIVPAIVIPLVVVATGLIVLLLLLRRRKKRKGTRMHGKSRVEIAMESIDDRLKIPYKSLVFKKEIGAGSYGKVFIGEWKGTPVAIKVSSSVADMDGFFDEAKITVGLQQHPNVVQTFGVSLDGQLPCIVLELCEGGSLDNRLFDSDVTLTQQQKIALIKGIARGLYHLHTNNIVHRDLAARNVLLNKSGTPKISDFGMSRVLKSEAEKGKTRTNYGPIRWMAPESLRDLQYSTKSDVWSFGIVLYEIVSRNEPHIDVDPLEVAVKIKNESYHPSIPQNVDPVLREIMLACWKSDPNDRPSMEQICNKLNSSYPDE